MNSIILSVYTRVQNAIASLKDERGQDLVEYAALVGLIGIAAAVALAVLSPDIATAVGNFGGAIKNCIDVSAGAGYTCP